MAGGAIWLLSLAAAGLVQGLDVDLSSADSIKAATGTIAYDMLTFYTGNNTGDNPGNLPPPYYWWECGAMFGHLVEYYYYTGDASNNPATVQAISWQAGENGEFMPLNQTSSEGNDDQVYWAFAAMSAAELKFPPPMEGFPSYAAMAQAVFNLQTARWDPDTCGGGMRWQFNPTTPGYEFKNTPSNGGYFQLAARLGRYTGNETYTKMAIRMYDWMDGAGFFDKTDPTAWKVTDGVGIGNGCTDIHVALYSYNFGVMIGGLAYLYDHTKDERWMEPLQAILAGVINGFTVPSTKVFIEAGCEPHNNCNLNGLTFKSFTLRWMALAAQLVPSLGDQIWPIIEASAQGAAGQCDGGDDGTFCGFKWTTTTFDGTTGVGQQMDALAAIGANMIQVANLPAPLTLDTGATSKSDPSAGTDTETSDNPWLTRKITTGDRAGAGILTFLLLVYTLGGAFFLCRY